MFDLTKFVKAPKNKKELSIVRRKYYNGVIRLLRFYNGVISSASGRKPVSPSGSDLLDEIRIKSKTRTNISDHLETIFIETMETSPRLIVELGVGPGESTFVFEKAARMLGSKFLSVDIRKEMAEASSWEDWTFICEDDISFASKFKEWAGQNNIEPKIDVLFVDTSHKYEHTVQEIQSWFPFLSPRSKVMFHDTNTGPVNWYKDGGISLSYDIQRGVIRVVEEFLKSKFNEKKDFTDLREGWLIKHHASCNGLTILNKIKN